MNGAVAALALVLLGQAQPPASMTQREFVAQLVGAPHGPVLEGEALEAKTHEVALLLRCPVCQGSAIADSPSETAQNMKREVRDLLAQGYDREQVLRYFELSYGEFVRLQPKADGIGAVVWVAPGAALLLGLVILGLVLRKKGAPQPKPAGAPVPTATTLPDDPELARYVERVRELVAAARGGAR